MKTIPNEPAHPVKDVGVNVYDEGRQLEIALQSDRGDLKCSFGGFTKREAIAKDMLSALVSSGVYNNLSAMSLSKTAIELADTLINTLNENE